MSDVSTSRRPPVAADPLALAAQATAADLRARAALLAAIDELAIAPALRLDERTRAALATLLARMIASIAGELREHAARLLTAHGARGTAAALSAAGTSADDPIHPALVRDTGLVAECLARTRLELAAAAIPLEAPADSDTPSLLVRLARSPDRVVASAATAVLAGESARRSEREGQAVIATGLPSALHRPLVWHVAAMVRRTVADGAPGDATLDEALAAAARRNLAALDEDDRLERAAMRLAHAIDAHEDELPPLIEEALRDRRLIMVVALVAHAGALRFEVARGLFVEDDDRLWLLLRALGLPRATIARIGLALCEGDPRRDLDVFADTLDAVMALEIGVAGDAIASLRLEPEYRAALMALTERRA